MRRISEQPREQDVATAALIGLFFAAYLLVLGRVRPPSEAEWACADPILSLAPRAVMLWVPPMLALVVAALWWRRARPAREHLQEGAIDALIGAGIASAAVLSLWAIHGSEMPAFIPPEESAGPGSLLSMTAGFTEELACRLVLLPVCYFALQGRREWVRRLIAVGVTGLAFSLWHAAGEGDVSARFFVTRFAIPGVGMSALWMFSPSAVVAGHCSAHLLIPVMFESPVA